MAKSVNRHDAENLLSFNPLQPILSLLAFTRPSFQNRFQVKPFQKNIAFLFKYMQRKTI